jgi:hypothetical protein
MSPEMKKLLHLLHTQVGYSEQTGGYTKFGHWYDTVESDADYTSQPWCDMFLSWGAHKLGYAPWFGQFAYTVAHARWFKQHHAWGPAPVPGAVVFFDWAGTGTIDGIDHVGIVAKVDGKKIHTIEGNASGQVREEVHDQSSVVGYGYPEKIKAHQEQKVAEAGRATALTGGASVTVQAAVMTTGASAGAWTAARTDPDARTASHTTPASLYEPATTTRSVADFQPLPSIPPQLGDTAIITPLLLAVLAAAYLKIRRGSVRHAAADGTAEVVLGSPAPTRTPGNGASGEQGGWFTPVRMNAVADRANVPTPPPWPTMPVDRPAMSLPPAEALPADADPDADPADAYPAEPSAGPAPVYFMPDRPDPNITSEQQTSPRPSLYQGSDGLANALQAFWSTNLPEEHTGAPAAPPLNGRRTSDGPAGSVERGTSGKQGASMEQHSSDEQRADRRPPPVEPPASNERPSPTPPRRPKGGRHRKS